MEVLKAQERDLKVRPKHIRRDGFIPAALFGKSLGESIAVKIDKKDVSELLKTHSSGSTVTISYNGKNYPTLIRDLKYLHLSPEVEHMTFQVLVSDEPVNSTMSIIFLNRSSVRTGVLETPLTEIAYRALPADLVESVEVDLEGLQIGDIIRLSDLPVFANDKLEFHTPEDSVIVNISAAVELKDETEEEEEGFDFSAQTAQSDESDDSGSDE